MLFTETIDIAADLAKKATLKGIRLEPEIDTPLYELVNCTTVMNKGIVVDEALSVNPEVITEDAVNTFSQESDNTSHNAMLDALVTQVSTAVSSHLNFTRNVVLEYVNNFNAAVTKEMDAYAPPSISSYVVTRRYFPAILHEETFVQLLKKHAAASFMEPSITFSLPNKHPAELIEMIKLGNKNIDSTLELWAKSTGALSTVWFNLFSDDNIIKRDYTTVESLLASPDKAIDFALAIFLIAYSFKENSIKAQQMSKEELDEAIIQYTGAASNWLLVQIERAERDKEKGIVVHKYNRAGNTVIVNDAPYLDWLKKGGKNEVLFGMMVGNLVGTTAEALNSQSEQALKHWTTYVAIASTQYVNARLDFFRTILRTHFHIMLRSHVEAENEVFEQPNYLEEASKHFEEQLDLISTRDLDNITDTCCRLMTKGRFYYTNAYELLMGIHSATKDNEEFTIKEGALQASITYVVDYIADQIKVS